MKSFLLWKGKHRSVEEVGGSDVLERGNLTKLALFLLRAKNLHFDMTRYVNLYSNTPYALLERSDPSSDSLKVAEYPCGTVACAVGHGPMAGIKPLLGEDWSFYGMRVFTSDMYAYNFMFGGTWSGWDNTPKGAALRIIYFLTYGYPISYGSTAVKSWWKKNKDTLAPHLEALLKHDLIPES